MYVFAVGTPCTTPCPLVSSPVSPLEFCFSVTLAGYVALLDAVITLPCPPLYAEGVALEHLDPLSVRMPFLVLFLNLLCRGTFYLPFIALAFRPKATGIESLRQSTFPSFSFCS